MVHRGLFTDPNNIAAAQHNRGGSSTTPRRVLLAAASNSSNNHHSDASPSKAPSYDDGHSRRWGGGGSMDGVGHHACRGGGGIRRDGSPQLPSSGLLELIGSASTTGGHALLDSRHTPPLTERTPDGSFEQTPPWGRRRQHHPRAHHRSTTPTSNGTGGALRMRLLRPDDHHHHSHDAVASSEQPPRASHGKFSPTAEMSIEDIFAHATIVPANGAAPQQQSQQPNGNSTAPPLPRFLPTNLGGATPTHSHSHNHNHHQHGKGSGRGPTITTSSSGDAATQSHNGNAVAATRTSAQHHNQTHRGGHGHHPHNAVSAAFGRAAVKKMLERSDDAAAAAHHQRTYQHHQHHHQQRHNGDRAMVPPLDGTGRQDASMGATAVGHRAGTAAATDAFPLTSQSTKTLNEAATRHAVGGRGDGDHADRRRHGGAAPVHSRHNDEDEDDDDDVGMSDIAPLVALACQRIVEESARLRAQQHQQHQHHDHGEATDDAAATVASTATRHADVMGEHRAHLSSIAAEEKKGGCTFPTMVPHTMCCCSSITPPSSFSRLGGSVGRPADRNALLHTAMGASTSSFDSPSLRHHRPDGFPTVAAAAAGSAVVPTAAGADADDEHQSLPHPSSMRLLPGTIARKARASPTAATTTAATAKSPAPHLSSSAPLPQPTTTALSADDVRAMELLIRNVSKSVPYRGSGQLVVVASLIYLGRLSTKCSCDRYHVSNGNWLRLATVCLLVATKMYMEEAPFRVNKTFAEAASMPMHEVQRLEIMMLHLLDFSLVVQPQEVGQWCYWIHALAERRGMQTRLYRFFQTSLPQSPPPPSSSSITLFVGGVSSSSTMGILPSPPSRSPPSSFAEHHPASMTTMSGRGGGDETPQDQLRALLAQTAAFGVAPRLPAELSHQHHHSRVDSWGGASFSFCVPDGSDVTSPLPSTTPAGGGIVGFPPMLRLEEPCSTPPAEGHRMLPPAALPTHHHHRHQCCGSPALLANGSVVGGRLFTSVFVEDDFVDDDRDDDDLKPPTPPLADNSPMKRFQTQAGPHAGGGVGRLRDRAAAAAEADDDDDVMNVFTRITRAAAARACLSPLSSSHKQLRQQLSPIGVDGEDGAGGSGAGGGAARFLTTTSTATAAAKSTINRFGGGGHGFDDDDDFESGDGWPRRMHQRRLSPPC